MKPFKTYEEQVEILKSRGLLADEAQYSPQDLKVINKPNKILIPVNSPLSREFLLRKPGCNELAKEILKTYGYYNIVNQYNKPFLNSDGSYQSDVDFFMLFSLQQIDNRIKNNIFYPILLVEQRLKACISYEFAKAYGPFEGENMDNYIEPYFQDRNYNNHLSIRMIDPETGKRIPKSSILIDKLKKIYRNNEYAPFKHYKDHHHHIPIWVFINKFSFGELLHFYEVLKIQQGISANFYLNPGQLRTMMMFLKHVRNDCAHFAGFYNQKYPSLKTDVKLLNDFQSNFNFTSQKEIPNIFLLLIIFKYLLPKDDLNICLENIKNRIFKYIFDNDIYKIGDYIRKKLAINSKEDYEAKIYFLKNYIIKNEH